jgi:hypothetical protein
MFKKPNDPGYVIYRETGRPGEPLPVDARDQSAAEEDILFAQFESRLSRLGAVNEQNTAPGDEKAGFKAAAGGGADHEHLRIDILHTNFPIERIDDDCTHEISTNEF